ncbi:MAG: DUF3237 domain-containing protein [Acidimicrobiales bacterium]
MGVELTSLGRLTIRVDDQLRMESGPFGTRLVGTAAECRWDGDRVTARGVLTPATDWVLLDSEGNGTVDARMTLETDDGALICLRYQGRVAYRGEAGARVVVAPTFETNDPRYAWLNWVQAVGKGARQGRDLVYELYEVG